MRFDVITIFPETIRPYLNESILKRAQKNKKITVKIHDLRACAIGKYRKVDDRPFGGGPGMVMRTEPLVKAVRAATAAKPKRKSLVLLCAAAGKQFTAAKAAHYAKQYKQIVIVAGRYEGIDERVKKVVQAMGYGVEEISMGPYVLTGGELPAMAVIDAVARQIPGVLGKQESLEEYRGGVGTPVYTRPEVLKYQGKTYRVPAVLKSGDHKKIEQWRSKKKRKYAAE